MLDNYYLNIFIVKGLKTPISYSFLVKKVIKSLKLFIYKDILLFIIL
jgi:hypothetical protein